MHVTEFSDDFWSKIGQEFKRLNIRVESWAVCQELAKNARYAPEAKDVIELASAAVEAASHADGQYNAVYPLAWPLRALLERDELNAASDLLDRALIKSKMITPRSGESEAVYLILQAVMYGQNELWPLAFKHLMEASLPIEHWRQRRNMRDAILMIADRDFKFATDTTDQLDDVKLKRRLLKEFASGGTRKPRDFFWSSGL